MKNRKEDRHIHRTLESTHLVNREDGRTILKYTSLKWLLRMGD
jgi:hypothetical protein